MRPPVVRVASGLRECELTAVHRLYIAEERLPPRPERPFVWSFSGSTLQCLRGSSSGGRAQPCQG